ncbi:MAG: translocation and assembly module TamB [Arcticibacterium sp.]|jgi:translocation and assembly module TamB
MAKLLKVILAVIGSFVLFLIALFWYLNGESGQRFLTNKVNDYLKTKIETPFSIGAIRYSIPDYISLGDIYIEDQSQKSILESGNLRLDMSMWALAQGLVDIDRILVENTKVNVYREAPNENFNYQFLLDALNPASSTPDSLESGTDLDFALSEVRFSNLDLNFLDSYEGYHIKSKVNEGSLTFNEINPSFTKVHISKIDLGGGYTIVKTFKPLAVLPAEELGSEPLDIDLESIQFHDFSWRFNGDDLGIDNNVFFKKFETAFNVFDLENNKIDIERITLENSKVTLALRPNQSPIENLEGEATQPWAVNLNDFLISNTRLIYDDFNNAKLAKGFDYNHIDARNTTIELSDLQYSEKGINLNISDVSFSEKSSLKLESLSTALSYSEKGILLKKFKLKTPFSKIGLGAILKYNSLEDFTSNIGKVSINLLMDKSEFGLSDMLLFNPDLSNQKIFQNARNKKIIGEVTFKGGVNELSIGKFKLAGFEGSRIDISGRLQGLDDLKKLNMAIDINDLSTNKALINLVLPDTILLADFVIPDLLSLKGKVTGNADLLNLNTILSSSLGDITLIGRVRDLADENAIRYEGNLKTVDLAIDKLFKKNQGVGILSTDVFLKSDASFQSLEAKGQIQKLFYGDYLYQGLDFDAQMKDSVVVFKASSKDPNADLQTNVIVDLNGEAYPIIGKVIIDNLNLSALGLYDLKEDIVGEFDIDIKSLLAEKPEGRFDVRNFALGSLKIDEFFSSFSNREGKNFAKVESPFLKANIDGDFNYTELSSVLLNEANGYFEFDPLGMTEVKGNQNFTINAVVYEHPIWGLLVPDLKFDKNISLSSELKDSNLKADMSFEKLAYSDFTLEDFQLTVNGDGNSLKGGATLGRLNSGGFGLARNNLSIDLNSGILQMSIISRDSVSNDKRHSVAMQVQKLDDLFKVNLRELTVDKNEFKVNDSPIYYGGESGISTEGLTLSRGQEKMEINANEKLLKIMLSQIKVTPFANFLGYAEEEIKGVLDGDVRIEDYLENYEITGVFKVNKLEVGGIEGGDLTLNLEEIDEVHAKLNGGLDGKNSQLSFIGNLGLTESSPIDFNVNIGKVEAKFIQSFSDGQLRNSRGYVNGNLKLRGTADKPLIDGKMSFVDYNFTADYLGIPLKMDNQPIYFKGNKINFENFIVKDSLNQKMTLKGDIDWSDVDKVIYNVKLNAKNFLLIDTQKGSNELFFGKANVDANMQVTGIGSEPSLNGKIRVNEQSNVTFIMPSEIETAESNGVVSFVPPTKTEDDVETEVLQIPRMKLENGTGLASEIILDIETDPKAQINIIIDELSGDNLKVKGTANLTVGVYPTGEIFTIGVYEIASGSYDFSFEFLRRNFQIEPGSMLIWSGDPYQASLQMKALYEVNADIQSLNSFGLNLDGFGKVPIDVILNIEGTIQNPLISFDLKASPKAESTIKAIIENNDLFASLRKNQSEMNQQVFSLLIFNKFLSAESVNISSAINTQALARQSVSKLLTEQLNVLAGDVLGSVGLNFGLNSDQLNTGDGNAYRTNLNVGLKKSFLNDRIKVSVGKNFELENGSGIDQNSAELLDNIEVGYNITADGRYAVKVYRNSQFQTVLEGFVLETGVSFVLSSDYDQVKELFKKSKPLK